MYTRLFRSTLVALLLFAIVVPSMTSTVKLHSNQASVVFAPPTIPPFTPAMPLPAPMFNGSSSMPAPVSGVLHILIIVAAFSDINYTVSAATIKQEWFGSGPGSVASFYREISFGSVTLTGDVFGWYKLPYPESHYGMDCLSVDDADCSGSDQSWQVANDAVVLAQRNASLNFNNYDHFVFIHSGNGEESSGVKNDVWSVTYLGGVYVRTNTRTLTKFNVDPELEANGAVPIGVYCHEFGHNLGLPDLYNTSNGQTILGPWELMDKGLWNGNPPGSSPAHMGAWDKIQLGFVTGSMLATANAGSTSTYTVDPTEVASSNVHVIQIPLTNPSQYYLIEVRTTTGFDAALPATGVLISYVDNTALIGRVHIINGHPSVPNLVDAVWDVGQTFTDSKNNVAVTITGRIGIAYQVTVNRGGSPPPPPNQNNQTQTYIDLAIVNITAQPQVITTPNTTVTINVQISNLGTGTAPNFGVQVNLDSQAYTTLQVNSVGPGGSTQATFIWVSTIGSHVFEVIVDPNHVVNDTNRANNIATFNLSVGPTLTINFPSNLTSAGNLWVSVNGQKYNVTSNQFQLSVPNGTITVQIEPAVNTSRGVRGLFINWADGITFNPRQISVTSNTALQAIYATQYLLTVDPNGGSTTQSAWYNWNANITVFASNPSNVVVNTSRLLFNGWSGDMQSNSTSFDIEITKPVSLRANWVTQYYVTVISPAGSPTGGGWYTQGQIATVSVQSTVQYSNGTRQIFNGWNSTTLGRNPSGRITVNSPTTLRAAWKTQYLVTVNSPYGTTFGSGWYDLGSTAPVAVQSEIDYSNATRRLFNGWSGDLTASTPNMTVRVDAPRTLNAQWSTQYQITLKVNGLPNATTLKLNLNSAYYDLSVNNKYQAWYTKGATLNPVLNQTIADGFIMYKFSGWQNSTGATVNGPLSVNAPQTFVASYAPEMSLPPIPGFPIEAILLGMLLGMLVMALTRQGERKRLPKHAEVQRSTHWKAQRATERQLSQALGFTSTYVPHFWQNGQASPGDAMSLMKT